MEFVLVIAALILIRFAIGWIFGAGANTIGAAVDAASGKGTFSENMSLRFQGMGPFEIRIREEDFGEDGETAMGYVVEGRGMIPVTHRMKIGFITSIVDVTEGEDDATPVFSHAEVFMEPETTAYCHLVEGEYIEVDHGFLEWARLGAVFLDCFIIPGGFP